MKGFYFLIGFFQVKISYFMESKARSEVRKLTEFESFFLQIIEYSNQVTDDNFQEYAELGYDLLRKIHHLGMNETQIYERFFTHYTN